MKEIKDIKLKKKWKLHIVHNSHTDLGYTHRQEYLYRAHSKYIERIIDIIEKEKDYKWTVEVFWMVENFKKWSTPKYISKFEKFVKSGNIEITTNYLNMVNISDAENVLSKGKQIKSQYPQAKTALQQDVNAISLQQAIPMAKTGTKNMYVSIHTHHGMFIGEGKQRGFLWDLGNGKKIKVWGGEHYQLGNEMFMAMMDNHKYTFKDDIKSFESDQFKQATIRLKNYLKLLESEGYKHNALPIAVSGIMTDNGAPNANVSKAVKKLNEFFGKEIEIKMSTLDSFFKDIDATKLPIYKGEWSSWWIDGAISTPEEIRLYRETQNIYKIILEWNKNNKKEITDEKIHELEDAMMMFAEHTWGSWSSQGNPFSNGNNLLLARKRAMANKASELAWTLLDEIKEIEGYEIIKLKNKGSYTIVNPYKKVITKVISLPVPGFLRGKYFKDRYINMEDILVVKNKDGKILPSIIGRNMGGLENINTNIDNDDSLMVSIKLKPLEKTTIKVSLKEQDYEPFTSSYRQVGVENEDDILGAQLPNTTFYNRNGIENEFYKIVWNRTGVTSIFDKKLKKELLQEDKSITPIYVLSAGDSRRRMGRNRQGPSFKKYKGELVSHNIIVDRDKIQIIQLKFKLPGTKRFDINISLSNIEKNIRFETIIQKTNELESENLYLDFPFVKNKEVLIHRDTGFFKLWKEQLPLSNIDYLTCENGLVVNNADFQIALSTPDCPLLQLGSLDFERRRLMGMKLDVKKSESMVWLMTNYWETNFKGSLEGNYKFKFEITSDKNTKKWLKDINEVPIGFIDYSNKI